MRSPLLLAGLVLSSLTLTAAPRRAQAPIWPHVTPTGGVKIPAASGDSGLPLQDLLREYSRLTDCHILMADDTHGLVRTAKVAPEREMEVPVERLHKVVEAILIQNDFVLTIRNDSAPYILALESLNSSARTNLRQKARYVPIDELESWEEHPAYLIHTVIDLPHIDVRTLSNTMRAMLTDANTQSIIPVGNSHSLILTGFAPQIVELTRMMKEIDASEKRAIESRPAPEVAPEESEGR